MCRLLAKDPGEPQQVSEGECVRPGARQGGLPAGRGQDRALAAPDQPDEDLGDDRGAYRTQPFSPSREAASARM